jgi:hypothetical protein
MAEDPFAPQWRTNSEMRDWERREARAPMTDAEKKAAKKGKAANPTKVYKQAKLEAARYWGKSVATGIFDSAESQVAQKFDKRADEAAKKMKPKKVEKIEGSKRTHAKREAIARAATNQELRRAQRQGDPFSPKQKPGFTYQPPEKKGRGSGRFGRLGGLGGLRMGGGGVPRVR